MPVGKGLADFGVVLSQRQVSVIQIKIEPIVFPERLTMPFLCATVHSIHQGSDRRNVYPAVSVSVPSMHSSC